MVLFEGIILTEEECDKIVNSVTDWELSALKIKNNSKNDKIVYNGKKRKSYSSSYSVIKGSDLFSKINIVFNKFDYELTADKMTADVLKYKEGHFIFKHTDYDSDFPTRFCALVIQLSHPSSYIGGDFNYYLNGGEKYTMNGEIGNGIVIRPDVYHEVTTITEGERYSFVIWIDTNEIKPLHKLALI